MVGIEIRSDCRSLSFHYLWPPVFESFEAFKVDEHNFTVDRFVCWIYIVNNKPFMKIEVELKRSDNHLKGLIDNRSAIFNIY